MDNDKTHGPHGEDCECLPGDNDDRAGRMMIANEMAAIVDLFKDDAPALTAEQKVKARMAVIFTAIAVSTLPAAVVRIILMKCYELVSRGVAAKDLS